MKITITSRKPLLDDRYGRMANGMTFDMPDNKAMFYVSRGEAVRYETKVLQDRPIMPTLQDLSLSALQVGQVSPQTTSQPSEPGVRRRGRPKKESS